MIGAMLLSSAPTARILTLYGAHYDSIPHACIR